MQVFIAFVNGLILSKSAIICKSIHVRVILVPLPIVTPKNNSQHIYTKVLSGQHCYLTHSILQIDKHIGDKDTQQRVMRHCNIYKGENIIVWNIYAIDYGCKLRSLFLISL